MPTAPISIQPDSSSPLMVILGFSAGASASGLSSFADSLWSALGKTAQPAAPAGGSAATTNLGAPAPKKEKGPNDLLDIPTLASVPVLPSVFEVAQPPTAETGTSAIVANPAPTAMPTTADPISQSVSQPAVSDAASGATCSPEAKLIGQDTTPLSSSLSASLPASSGISYPQLPSSNAESSGAASSTPPGSLVAQKITLANQNPAPSEDAASLISQASLPGDPQPKLLTNSVKPNPGIVVASGPITSQASLQLQPGREASSFLALAQTRAGTSIDPSLIKIPVPQSPQPAIPPHNAATHSIPASQDVSPKPPAVDSQGAEKLTERIRLTEMPFPHLSVSRPIDGISNDFVSAIRGGVPPSSSPADEPITSSHQAKDVNEARTVPGPAAAASKSDSNANSSGGAPPQEPAPLVPVPGSRNQTSNDTPANGGAAPVNSAANLPSEDPSPSSVTKAPLPTPDPPAPQAPAAGPVQVAHLVDRLGQAEMHIGVRTSAFGSVEVHTVVRDNQVGVAMGSERGDLKAFLTSEVPGLQAAFGQHDLRLDAIHFLAQGANLNAGLSGGTDSHSRSFRQEHTTGGFATLEESPANSAEAETVKSGSGLNVHA